MQEMRSCYDNLLFAVAATANSAYVQDGSLRRRLKNVEIPKEDLKNLEVGDFDCCC
ncbi:hypothetical protein OROMI_011280 [Orobanche minor]